MEQTRLFSCILYVISCEYVNLNDGILYFKDKDDKAERVLNLQLKNSIKGNEWSEENKLLEYVEIGKNYTTTFARSKNDDEIKHITYRNHDYEELIYYKKTPEMSYRIEITPGEAKLICKKNKETGRLIVTDGNAQLINQKLAKEAYADFLKENKELDELMKEQYPTYGELSAIIGPTKTPAKEYSIGSRKANPSNH